MKKVFSLILSLIMAVCVLPAGVAFAAGSGAISAGQTATVTLDHDGDKYILHFTPERTGEYRIASHLGEDMVDPFCYIRDSKGLSVVDDSLCDDVIGEDGTRNPNFDVTAEFTADEEYTIICKSTDITGPVSYFVALTEVNPPEPDLPEVSAPVLQAKELTQTGFTVYWDDVEGATEYQIYDATHDPAAFIKTVTENEYVFTGLTPNTEYKIRVTAANAEHSASSEISVTTLAQEEPEGPKPQAPTGYNVYARGDGGTDLYLEWNNVAGADGYRVYIYTGTYGQPGYTETLKGITEENRFVFTDLVAAWEYNVMVVAYNDYGSASSKTHVCAAPSPVLNFSAEMNGSTINAKWDVQASHGYYIQWSTDKDFQQDVNGAFITGSGATSYAIGADSNETYYVRVRAWKWYQGARLYGDFTQPVMVPD